VVRPAEIEAELKRIGHALKPLEIVVVNTSAGLAGGGAVTHALRKKMLTNSEPISCRRL
jgi:hypothetical protein